MYLSVATLINMRVAAPEYLAIVFLLPDNLITPAM